MKDICNYEGLYKIDKNGNVFSVRNNKFLKRMTFPSGYEYVHLCNGKGKTKLFRVHRLVAEAFIGSELYVKGKPYVKSDFYRLGKTVFLTREEAEKALEESEQK